MRTAIFVGLIAIASAILNEPVFTVGDNSLDTAVLSILCGIFIGMDVVEYIVKIRKDEK